MAQTEARQPAQRFNEALHRRLVEGAARPSVLVDPHDEVVHLSERAGRYLVHPSGAPATAICDRVREELRPELRLALRKTRDDGQPRRAAPVGFRLNGKVVRVVMEVQPSSAPGSDGYVLVLFDELPTPTPDAHGEPPGPAPSRGGLETLLDRYEASRRALRESNQDLASMNEELRSTVDELEERTRSLERANRALEDAEQKHRSKVEELDQLSTDLENLLAATEIATLFLDSELRVRRYTPRLKELLNVRTEDRGRPVTDLTHRLVYDELIPDARRVLDRLVPVEREVRDTDGRWFIARMLPYRGPGDRIEGVVLTFIDITGRKELQERVRRAEKMEAVGRLAGGIAHDFNNLLTVQRGHASLLLDALADGHTLRPHAEEIAAAGDRAAHLTQQLLAFGREQTLRARPVELAAVVRELDRMLRRLIPEHIELRLASQNEVRVKADPTQLHQVVMNLVVNAADAIAGNGRITLRTDTVHLDPAEASALPWEAEPGAYGQLSVVDTGTGMDEEVLEHVFEPFFTTKPIGQGTGLGLATVYGIVKQSGGHIFVDSEPGRGTTVRVLMPTAPEEEPTRPPDDRVVQGHRESSDDPVARRPRNSYDDGVVQPPGNRYDDGIVQGPRQPSSDQGLAGQPRGDDEHTADAASRAAGEGADAGTRAATVLMAEDEVPVRRLVKRVLERAGYTVLEAATGAEALALLADRSDVELVISDVVMPDVGGVELYRRLREQGRDLEIVLTSGYSAEELPDEVSTVEAAFLAKPFTPAQLLARVQEAIEG